MRAVMGFAMGGVLLFGALNAEGADAGVTAVDTALVLAGDVSGSMTLLERQTQRDGLAAALRDPAVMEAIHLGPSVALPSPMSNGQVQRNNGRSCRGRSSAIGKPPKRSQRGWCGRLSSLGT